MVSLLSRSLRWAISFSNSAYSAFNSSIRKPVSWLRRISTMAFDCRLSRLKRASKFACASAGVRLARMIRTTSSMWSTAIIKPSKICARSCAFFNSKRVRRVTTSMRCSMNAPTNCLRFSNIGRPFTSAMLFTANDDCRAVNLYSLLSTTCAFASRFTSITIRMSRFDWSLMSAIPSIFLSLTNSAMFFTNSLFTMP